MQVIEGDVHDPLCATYQTLEVARLNAVLRACGIADVKVRRQICEQYFFDAGYFLDSGWFSEQGRKFRPGVYFIEVGAAKPTEDQALLLPDSSIGTMFHVYAHGAAAWLFDDHREDASEIETGDINEV